MTTEPLPPGPAFIPATTSPIWGETEFGCGCIGCRIRHGIPDGYIWREATDHTMSGWVRPSGGRKDPACNE